jgi:hypothetical protein
MEDLYRLLGVDKDADGTTIRKAWLELAHKHHPDHNPGSKDAHELFISLRKAYEILSDTNSRREYDQKFTTSTHTNPYVPVFKIVVDQNPLRKYDELRVSFVYTGSATHFKRPSFKGFLLSSRPFVSHRMLMENGIPVKETTITFLVAPTKSGCLRIDSASMLINGCTMQTESLFVDVIETRCEFLKKQLSDGPPLMCSIHLVIPAKGGKFPVGESKRVHKVAIPRSRVAYRFHLLGRSMKIVFSLFGATWLPLSFGIPFPFGLIIGNLVGGLNVSILYSIAGVRSRSKGALQNPLLDSYIQSGYKRGSGDFWPMDSLGLLQRAGRMIW